MIWFQSAAGAAFRFVHLVLTLLRQKEPRRSVRRKVPVSIVSTCAARDKLGSQPSTYPRCVLQFDDFRNKALGGYLGRV